jgi:hypothetical protein
MKPTKTIRPETVELPKILRDLPRCDFTTGPATTSEQSTQEGVLYGVNSLDEVVKRAAKAFTGPAYGTRKGGAHRSASPSKSIR